MAAHEYRYTVLFEPAEEGGYVVTCPALPGLVTEGDTLAEAREMAADAIRGYLDVNRRPSLTPDRRPMLTPLGAGRACPGSEQEGPARSGVTATSLTQRSAGGTCLPTGASPRGWGPGRGIFAGVRRGV